MYLLQLIALALSLTLMVFIVEAIRRRRLNVRYALLWLGAGTALVVLSVSRPLLDAAATAVGISYGPSLLFLVAFVFLFGIVLHYSLVISTHRDAVRRLAQAVALLTNIVEAQQKDGEIAHPSDADG